MKKKKNLSLLEIFKLFNPDKEFSKDKLGDLEARIRENSSNPVAATILSIIDTTGEWTQDETGLYAELLELIDEYENPTQHKFEEPAQATEFSDIPEEPHNEESPAVKSQSEEYTQPPEKIDDTIVNYSIIGVNAQDQAVKELSPEEFLVSSGILQHFQNREEELITKLNQASEQLEKLQSSKTFTSSTSPQELPDPTQVVIETQIGDILYLPQYVQVTSRVMAMYFHNSTPPMFIPKVDSAKYKAIVHEKEYTVQYIGGLFQDMLNPSYSILTFVVHS